ncbi:restriction endonuclease, partial [Patescibacteria group bacterium]|nr:restriction endonuclease [Patescibacteria group bacterium]
MTYRIEREKWILYRHTNNFALITAVAVNLKYFTKASLSKNDKLVLLKKLQELDYYKERNPELPLDSINHRINTLAYYMFGYKDEIDGESRFLFSPLGNLFLKHIEHKEKISKIFLTMLWA